MKKNSGFVKITSIALSVLLTLLLFAPMISASAAGDCDCDELPIIYIKGRSSIYEDKDLPESDTNHALPYVEDGVIGELVKELIPVFAKAYITNEYTEYTKLLVSAFEDVYSNFTLNENAEVTDNSGIKATWSPETMRDLHEINPDTITDGFSANKYIYRYFYEYDCRLDPCEIADDLHAYIESVKEVTGHDKVRVIARCLGSCIASAYFAKYGWEDIDRVMIYNPIMNGTAVTDSFFTGNVVINSDSIDYFASQQLPDGSTIKELIVSVITLANKNYSLGLTSIMINDIVRKIAPLVIPGIMKVTYGTFPGYWSMVSYDKYDEARSFIFNEEGDEEKYAGLLAKTDNYHETVAVRIEDIYKQMAADGVQVGMIAKYGYQLYPFVDNSTAQGDMIITLEKQSFGATAAEYGKVLSADYVADVKAAGNEKYLSVDGIVDASTCFFPDTTWFVKDIEHNSYPYSIDCLLARFMLSEEEMTVWSDAQLPQYLVYTRPVGESKLLGTIAPMTEENTGITVETPNIFEAFVKFIKDFFRYIYEFLMKIEIR